MAWFGLSSGAARRLVLGVMCCVGLVAVPLPASAVSSESRIDVLLCNPDDQASLTITDPPSDSVTTQPEVTVTGTVNNATHIDILVDGNFDHAFALGANQNSFTTTVHLSKGTHTITVKAIAICGFPDVSRSVVVTYQPTSPPTPPIPTPSPGPSQSAGGGPLAFLSPSGGLAGPDVIPGDEVPTELPAEDTERLDGVLFDRFAFQWPLSFAIPENPWWTIIRLVVLLLGLALVTYPLFVARRLAHTDTPPEWIVAFLRVIGLLLLLFAIFGLGLL